MSRSQSFPGAHVSSTSAPLQQTDAARETSLSAQRVTLLYEALPWALMASSGCALAVALLNWHVLPHDGLLTWLAFQLLLSAGRYSLVRAFRARTMVPASTLRWYRPFVIGSALAGLGWGAFPLFLFPTPARLIKCFWRLCWEGSRRGPRRRWRLGSTPFFPSPCRCCFHSSFDSSPSARSKPS